MEENSLEVAKYIQGKAFDYDAWIEAVRKLVA